MKQTQMKVKLFIVTLSLIIIAACKKDQYTTKPQLSFKKLNTNVLLPNQLLSFTLEYTDKEGDIQDSIYIEKRTSNCSNSDFGKLYALPTEIPKQRNTKGELEIRFAYGINLGYAAIKEPACQRNDTCVFRFALRDKAKNISDTVTSPQIVLIKR
jgi:hypothetical protein